MKWFKHMSASGSDEKLSGLLDAMGMEGYGMWWRLLEIISEQMDETEKCEVTYSLPRWSLLLYSHHHKVGKFIVTLESLGLCTTSKHGSNLTVIIPNLLKYRDNHTKNLQATCKKKASDLQATCKQEVEVEVEVEVDYKNPSAPSREPDSEPPPARVFINIPLNDKTEYCVSEDDVEGWQELFPAVDVRQEIREMKAWCDARPAKRKTRKGVRGFITNWLSKEQDKGGPAKSSGGYGRHEREFVDPTRGCV